MAKSFLDKIKRKKAAKAAVEPASAEDHESPEETVDHLWMKEDIDAQKPKLEKNPKIDTAILRNRIADKLAKANNN